MSDGEDVISRCTSEFMKDDEYYTVLVSRDIAKKDNFGTLYLKDGTEVPQNRVERGGKDYIKCCAQRGGTLLNVASPTMSTLYIRTFYKEVKKEFMGSGDISSAHIQNSDGNAEWFLDFIHLFFDQTSTTLNGNVLVSIHVHDVLQNVFAKRRPYVMDNTHTLVGFVSV